MKFVALVGSIRKESYNLKLAKFIKRRYDEQLYIEILNIRDLPHFDQDLEFKLPAIVSEFKKKVADADAVLLVTPEYNHSIPGVLKNAIDWLSRGDRVMIGKPSWLIGASTGRLGTVRAQMHMRDILFSSGVSSPLLTDRELYVNEVHKKFDESGKLLDQQTLELLDEIVEEMYTQKNN